MGNGKIAVKGQRLRCWAQGTAPRAQGLEGGSAVCRKSRELCCPCYSSGVRVLIRIKCSTQLTLKPVLLALPSRRVCFHDFPPLAARAAAVLFTVLLQTLRGHLPLRGDVKLC